MQAPRKRPWLPGLLIAVYLLIALPHIASPFLRHREGNCTFDGALARNDVWHGYCKLKFGRLETGSPDLSVYEDWRNSYYVNRPPVPILGISVGYQIFGVQEWVLRANLLLIGALTILIFSGLARRLLDEEGADLATSFFALVPMFAYFSHVVSHLTYVLFFSLLAWYGNVRWEEGRRFRILTFAALLLGGLCDWPAAFAALSIALHRLLRRDRFASLAILAIPCLAFTLHILHINSLMPEGHLIQRFLNAGLERAPTPDFHPLDFLYDESREVGKYFTVGLLILALPGILVSIRKREWPLLLFALLGIEEFLFAKLSARHDYLTFNFTPFLALSAARGAVHLRSGALRSLVPVCIAGAALQSAWFLYDLETRVGAYEVNWKAGLAVRNVTRPNHHILLTIHDTKQYTLYYSERAIASIETGTGALCYRPSAGGIPVPTVEALTEHIRRDPTHYDVVVVGDPDAARREIDFVKGMSDAKLVDEFRFFPPGHPLREFLERVAVRKEAHGAFLFYWMK